MQDKTIIPIHYCMYCGWVIDDLQIERIPPTEIECPHCKDELICNFQRAIIIEFN